MTGPEFVGGKVVAKAAKKALTESEATEAALAALSKDSPAMQRAAEMRARRVEVRQAVLLKLFRPLAKFAGYSKEYFQNDFPREMAERVADIPEESLVTPRPSLAVPAMEGLGYSLDEPDLKEMYLNLLATAMDGRRTGVAHPAFADIIKQLSPEEAAVLPGVLAADEIPAVEMRRENIIGQHYDVISTNLIELADPSTGELLWTSDLALWINNWARLGLITVTYLDSLVPESLYDWAQSHPEVVATCVPSGDSSIELNWVRGALVVTDFGRRFLVATTDLGAEHSIEIAN